MELDASVLDRAERIVFALRSLYLSRGYSRFRIGKFEEYDLYGQYKDFLVSDRVLTFTDTDGKLMALKPDVTLSIIRHSKDRPEELERLCYNESVYRAGRDGDGFREIMQTGLECIGAVREDTVSQVLELAAESLELCSADFVLEVSDLSLVSAYVNDLSPDPALRAAALGFVSEKNRHELRDLCRGAGVSEEKLEALLALMALSGPVAETLPLLRDLPGAGEKQAELDRLEASLAPLTRLPRAERIQLDFSLTGDTNYYNGVVFRGYLEGIGSPVLSGGQYDRLMERMGRKSRAIGFAVYLDRLDRLGKGAE